MQATQAPTTKITRGAVTYCIFEKEAKSGLEFRVMHGNKIIARYSDEASARARRRELFRLHREIAKEREGRMRK